jgi:hypothetical protein
MLWREAEATVARVIQEAVDPLLADALWGTAAGCMLTGRISAASQMTLREPWLAAGLAPVLPGTPGL